MRGRWVREQPQRWIPALLVLLSLAGLAQAQVEPTERPFLWMIEGQKPSFLYGTIHLPDERVLAIPQVVLNAVEFADALYVEVTPEEMASATPRLMLGQGKTLKDVLPKDLYDRTAAYVQSKGIPMMALQGVKVWVLMVQLQVLDYIQQMAFRQPLDMALYNQAKKAGKEVGGLETIDEQLQVFEGFSEQEQIELLAQALDELEKDSGQPASYLERLLLSYLEGDGEKLHQLLFEEVDPNDPLDQKFLRTVFVDRDERMAERIAAKLESDPSRSYFFAIGSGHLTGPQSVRKKLEERGLSITRLTPQDAQRFAK